MHHPARKIAFYVSMAAVGAAVAIGCSSAPDESDPGNDPTLNAANGCANSACTACESGFTAKKRTDGSSICSSKPTVFIPLINSTSIFEEQTGVVVTTLKTDRLYRVKMTAADTAIGGVTVWAQATDRAGKAPPRYLCKLVTVDLDKWDRSAPFLGYDNQTGVMIHERVSDRFSVDAKCLDAVSDLAIPNPKIDLQYSFDVEGMYDAAALLRRTDQSSYQIRPRNGDVRPWLPRETFTPVAYQKPPVGYDGGRNDAGLALLATDYPDEFAFLSQRVMYAQRLLVGSEKNSRGAVTFLTHLFRQLPTDPLSDVGPWSRSAPKRVSVTTTEFKLESSVLRIGPRFLTGEEAVNAPPSAASPFEFVGTFSATQAGSRVSKKYPAPDPLDLYPSISIGIYMRPLGGTKSDWTLVTQADGVRTPTQNTCNTCPTVPVKYAPKFYFRYNADAVQFGPTHTTSFGLRANTIVRQKLYKDWYSNTQFELAACPFAETKDEGAAGLDLATGPEDTRCKRTTATLERLALGRSIVPAVDVSANQGATGSKAGGGEKLSSTQTATDATSCTKQGNGSQNCTVDQQLGFSTSGAFQANIVNADLETSTIDDGKMKIVPPPKLEVFGFNLVAGLTGASETDTQTGSVKFPIGSWFQALLMKSDGPRPPGGGIEKKTFTGGRVGLAYVFERAWPPQCGPYGCVQVIVQLFAGGTLDGDVTITPQTTGSANAIPCAKTTDPSRCFVSYPGEGETVNALTLPQAARYCSKYGGRLARLRDATEELSAATADAQAVTEWNRIVSHQNKQVTKQGYLGFEKTAILNYDPATCQEILDNGKLADGACFKNEKLASTFYPPDHDTSACRSFPFYATTSFNAVGYQLSCLDSYGAPAPSPSSCDAPNYGAQYQRVYSTVPSADRIGLFDKCFASATPAWGDPADPYGLLLSKLGGDGKWVDGGAYSHLDRVKVSDKNVVLDGTGSTVWWPTVSESATYHPICEFEKATSANGVTIGATFTPSVAAGASVSIIYGNRYIAGVGVKLTVNLVQLSLPFSTTFNTVSAVRENKKIVTGGASFSADFNIQFLSGSLGVVLYTALKDFEYPVFEFNGAQINFPLFKFEKTWRYN
jgi:hypothetical protein